MITNDEIKALHKSILAGEKVKIATEKLGISRAFYYQKIKELGLSTKRERDKAKRYEDIRLITDMHDLATLLNTDFNTIHKSVNIENSIEANIKRMNYLKNHSPLKFQEAVSITILNFYKMDALMLIKTLKNM